jgi:hypothetical protein
LATVNAKVSFSQQLVEQVDPAGNGIPAEYEVPFTALDGIKLLKDVNKDTDVTPEYVEQAVASQVNPNSVFTLTEIRTIEVLDDTIPTQTLTYWGNPETGEGVPAGQVWDTVSDYLFTAATMSDEVFGVINDSLSEIRDITVAGLDDSQQGGMGDQFTNTGDATSGGDADTGFDTGKEGDYTGNYQIRVTLQDGTVAEAVVALTQEQFEYLNGLLFDANGNSRLFEKEVPVTQYLTDTDADADGLGDVTGMQFRTSVTVDGVTYNNVVVDSNDNPIAVPVVIKGDTIVTDYPIILKPNYSNGGIEEGAVGNMKSDDLIVAGRLELLHGAYIDGGEGENTLEIDAKGHFAQPKELLNIQHIKVENLPNIYTTVDSDGDVLNGYPDVQEGGVADTNQNSIIDLSRAVDIETLTVTEGSFQGLNGQTTPGALTLTGIRNGVTTTLDGGFTQNVTLNYGELTDAAGVNLVFHNLSMGDADTEGGAWNAQLNVAHNAETLNIESTGAGNFLDNGNLGGELSTLNISGDAHLYIEDDLNASFHNGNPVTIDASANTGGVNLTLTGSEQITFMGSQGDDRFAANTVEFNTAGVPNLGGSDQRVTIVDMDGDNYFQVESSHIDITVGDGANKMELDGGEFNDDTGSMTTATVVAGNGANDIAARNLDIVNITTGDGDNKIGVNADEITITTGAGNDTVIVSGEGVTSDLTDDDSTGVEVSNTALLNINVGAGENTVVLGGDISGVNYTSGVTATEGSVITGENITLYIEEPSDLRAAELSGIENVVLSLSKESSAVLTLTDAQFAAIGADAFSVDQAPFYTQAELKLIITESTSLTDLGVDDLPTGINLILEIQDGVTLEMTAEQLHTRVAAEGVTLANDNNGDQQSGSVLITNAGLDFDPFNSSDDARSIVDGVALSGGSLGTDFINIEDTTDPGNGITDEDDYLDGIQRDEWGSNVLIDRNMNGYDRPADVPSYSRLVINTDEMSEIGPFETIETFLRITGESDLTFTPVEGGVDDWGRPIEGGSAIALGVDSADSDDSTPGIQPSYNDFIVDFSSVGGEVNNLTLANFQNADAIYGNGARVNVELTGDVGDDGIGTDAEGGLVSSGVHTYVVTDMNDADREFWTCETTKDLETLGLRGNYGEALDVTTITFGNTERNVDFLMEVVYDKQDGYAVGSLVANFARGEGADAVVNVVGLDTLPAGEVQLVGGISTNASTATVNVEGGNTEIKSLAGSNLDALTLTADADVTVSDELPTGLMSIDASGVAGTLTATIDEPTVEGLTIVGAETGTSLQLLEVGAGDIASIDGVGPITLTIGDDSSNWAGDNTVNLSETDLSNIEQIVMTKGSTLSIKLADSLLLTADKFVLSDAAAAVSETETLNLVIPEGETLELTVAEYRALLEHPDLTVTLTGKGSIHLTDVTQADIGEGDDVLDLTAINLTGDDSTVTMTLAEDVDMSEVQLHTVDTTDETFDAIVDVFNIGDFTLTLGDVRDAHEADVIGGDNSVLRFTDTDSDWDDNGDAEDNSPTAEVLKAIDASGFDVKYVELLNVLSDNINVDELLGGLPSSEDRNIKVVYNGEGWARAIDQVVDVTAGTSLDAGTDGFVAFNTLAPDTEIANFTLNLQGGNQIRGDLVLNTTDKFNDVNEDGTQQTNSENDLMRMLLQSLTINSDGDGSQPNLFTGEVINVIDGDITPMAQGSASATNRDNNLKTVTINASQALDLNGAIVFSSVVDDDDFVGNDDDEATVTLNVTGTADVEITQLDVSDNDIAGLTVNHTGTGTLTVTGASPAIFDGDADGDYDTDDTANLETLTFTGTGDIVIGTDGDDDTVTEWGITASALSEIDASGLSGDLDLGVVADIDSANFAFVAGSGVTTLTLTDSVLNSTAEETDTGWSFDFSNAAAGSEFHLDPAGTLAFEDDSTLSINMGPNGTLFIDESMDLSDLDLTILGDQPIVLAKGVTLTLNAAQADGLNIVAADDVITDPLDPNYDVNEAAFVDVVDLGSAAVNLSGISADVARNVTINENEENVAPADADHDVTLHVDTVLGSFTVVLEALVTGDDENLSGQTIRFTTVEQAERAIQVVDTSGTEITVGGPNSTNVVWLFDTLAAPVETGDYSAAIGRLWITDELIANYGGDIEDLFTSLRDSILRAEFADADLLDALLSSNGFNRQFEVVSFLELGDLTFSDVGVEPDEFVRTLDIHMGGQATIGNILLDDEVNDPDYDPASVQFEELTITSRRALDDDYYLAAEEYVNNNDGIITAGEHELPNNINTVGDIASGAGVDLLSVVLNTGNVSTEGSGGATGASEGAALSIGTITFDADEGPEVANLTVTGQNDVTIAALDTANANVDTLNINLTGHTGNYVVTGASPAAAVSNTEVLDIVVGAGSKAYFGHENVADEGDDPDIQMNANAGIAGADLSEINISGVSGGAVNLGVIAEIDSLEFKLNVKSPLGEDEQPEPLLQPAVTATLGAANGMNPVLADGGVWTFDGEYLDLTITGDVELNAGSLHINNVGNTTLHIEGDVDFTGLAVNDDATQFQEGLAIGEGETIVVNDDSTLTLRADQLAVLFDDNTNTDFDVEEGEGYSGNGVVILSGEGDLTDLEAAFVAVENATSGDSAPELHLSLTADATITLGQLAVVAGDVTKDGNALTLELADAQDVSETDTSDVDVIRPVNGADVVLNLAQVALLAPEVEDDPETVEDETYIYTYGLKDTWENLSDPANLAAVLAADSGWTISDLQVEDGEDNIDLGNISAQEAAILSGAKNYDELDVDFTVEDTWAGWVALIDAANADPVDEGAATALAAALNGDFTYDITDIATADFTDLTVEQAALLIGADGFTGADPAIEYSISDEAANIFQTGTTYVAGVEALLEGATGVKAQGVTVAQQAALDTDVAINLTEYTLTDTWAILSDGANATVRTEAESYAISDIDATDPVAVNFPEGKEANVTQAIILTGASNFDEFAGELFVEDSKANLFEGNDFIANADTALAEADDLVVTDAVNASQAYRLEGLGLTGDALSYDLVGDASAIAALIDTQGATIFDDADSILHNGIGETEVATGTDGVVDTFVYSATDITQSTEITNFSGAAADADLLDLEAVLADGVIFGTDFEVFDGAGAASDNYIVSYSNAAELDNTTAAALFESTDLDSGRMILADGNQVLFVNQDDDGADFGAQVFLVDNNGGNITATEVVQMVGVNDLAFADFYIVGP